MRQVVFIMFFLFQMIRLRSKGGPINDDLEKSKDYLNANFADVIGQTRAYMATQGPIQSTFLAFWKMVREHNTQVIVMITDLFENGKVRRPKATFRLIMTSITNVQPHFLEENSLCDFLKFLSQPIMLDGFLNNRNLCLIHQVFLAIITLL